VGFIQFDQDVRCDGSKDSQIYMEGSQMQDDHDGVSGGLIDQGKIKRQANICGGGIGVRRPICQIINYI
jgi:hypothetical protein